MGQNQVHLQLGESLSTTLNLPADWEILPICMPEASKPCLDIEAETARALDHPIGLMPIENMACEAKKITVVVDDISRPTPIHLFFDKVMERVKNVGVLPENVTVLTALGVHRAMTKDEMIRKIGLKGTESFRWANHDYRPGPHLVKIGRTSRGTDVRVNRLVVEADLVITMGCIEPHTMAGFGGGYKTLFPGVAGGKTVAGNHALSIEPGILNRVGTHPKDNPMRCDLEECGKLLGNKVFIVNAVLDGSLGIHSMVAGDPIKAHRKGIKISESIFGVKIAEPADVLITCGYPMNADFRQGNKALANTIKAVRPGGVICCVMAAKNGIGDMNLPKRKIFLGKKGMKALAPLILPLVGKIKFGMQEEDVYITFFTLQAWRRNDIYFYSPNLPVEMTGKLPFLDVSNTEDEIERKLRAAMPGGAKVLVFPYGGVTYPILP